jgi:hypothetical protein
LQEIAHILLAVNEPGMLQALFRRRSFFVVVRDHFLKKIYAGRRCLDVLLVNYVSSIFFAVLVKDNPLVFSSEKVILCQNVEHDDP